MEAGGGGVARVGGGISMAVSIKHLHFFLPSTPLPSPPLSTSQSDRREELCSERSHLASTAPPPSNEICDRAEPRHLQLLSSSLYLPLSLSFSVPRSSSSPYVCPQRRPVQVSLASASLGEDEEGILSLLIVLGLQLIAANTTSCHACSAPQCFIMKRDTC